MNTGQWLRQATHQLEAAAIETARLDALVLLEDALPSNRARLLAEPTQELTTTQTAKLAKLLNRRLAHEPLAYIRGHAEFYGRDFVLSPAVLVPRPESEAMIELLLPLAKTYRPITAKARPDTVGGQDQSPQPPTCRIADVGTGSGALGITAQLELPETVVELLDIDSKALEVAKLNVDIFTPTMTVLRSDLLAGASRSYDILLCNLPYVPDAYKINRAAGFEPAVALYGGPDGLGLYRKLFQQIKNVAKRPLYILTEAMPSQHAALRALAENHAYELLCSADFIQVFRCS